MAETIAHRELRNNSSEILRRVQSGETFNITNHGEIVAILTPPPATPDLAPRVRRATVRGGWNEIPAIEIDEPTQTIIDELRGDR